MLRLQPVRSRRWSPAGCVGKHPGLLLLRRVTAARSEFAGFRFPPDVITLAVRWYLRYGPVLPRRRGTARRTRPQLSRLIRSEARSCPDLRCLRSSETAEPGSVSSIMRQVPGSSWAQIALTCASSSAASDQARLPQIIWIENGHHWDRTQRTESTTQRGARPLYSS